MGGEGEGVVWKGGVGGCGGFGVCAGVRLICEACQQCNAETACCSSWSDVRQCSC